MSHNRSHSVRHGVTDGGRDAGRTCGVTQGVTLLQTRPDQTRVLLTAPGGVSINESIHRQGSRADATHARTANEVTTQHGIGWMGCAEGGGW